MTPAERAPLSRFLSGKRIVSVSFSKGDSTFIDFDFEDGSRLELYCLCHGETKGLGWVPLTAEEVAEEESDSA